MRFSKTGPARRRAGWLRAPRALCCSRGCSAGSLGSSDAGAASAGATEITFLTGNSDTDVASSKAVIEAFQAANPGITVKTETRPGWFGG